jgi:ribokinase
MLYSAKKLETMIPMLSRTHILFLNHSEISQLTNEDFQEGAALCISLGCQIVAVTLGKGDKVGSGGATSYIRTAEQEYFIKPPGKSLAATDTTGAGDAFAAGFLYGWLNEKAPDECGRLGDTVARFSIARVGAREGLPNLQQLSKRYLELYDQPL